MTGVGDEVSFRRDVLAFRLLLALRYDNMFLRFCFCFRQIIVRRCNSTVATRRCFVVIVCACSESPSSSCTYMICCAVLCQRSTYNVLSKIKNRIEFE